MKNEKYLNFLKTTTFFNGLSDVEIIPFLLQAKECHYDKNRHICNQGDTAENFYLVVSGWIKLYRLGKDGNEIIISLITKGDVFCEESTFIGSDYPYNAVVAGKDASCLVIKAHFIRQQVRENSNIAFKMLASLSNLSNHISFTYENITTMNTAVRLGSFLVKLSLERDNSKNLVFPYNKSLVASRLGMKPESFSRAISKLKEDLGLEFNGREIKIPDLKKLENYCNIRCNNNCSNFKKLTCNLSQCDIYKILKIM